MERTLRLQHQNMRAIIPQRKTIDSIDYTVDDFKPSGNNLLDEWRIKRLSEYLTYKFPLWKRAGLKEFKINELKNYKGLENIDESALELLEKLDFEGSDRKFVLLADVFSSSGGYFTVQEDKTMIVNQFDQYDNMLVDIKSGTLTLIRIIEKSSFIGNLRINIQQGACLNLYNLYIANGEFLNSNVFINAEKNSKAYVKDFYFGGKINSGYFGIMLSGEEAYAEVRPYYLANKKNIIDILYLMRFYAPKTYGVVDSKGVLGDESKVVFRGIMDILSGSKEVEAHQSNHSILISQKAKVEAIPSLMVDENDVVASHAASSSPIDESMLFYLMTRGIPESDARKMIVRGVFESFKQELTKYGLEGVVERALNSVVG
ncbi:MAG: SufD family Fe-S cluster assembly protein [Fervidobacterium sp.]|nr:SufD family Fe-S cluster assembly protein [Fervidobacterium sp.]